MRNRWEIDKVLELDKTEISCLENSIWVDEVFVWSPVLIYTVVHRNLKNFKGKGVFLYQSLTATVL